MRNGRHSRIATGIRRPVLPHNSLGSITVYRSATVRLSDRPRSAQLRVSGGRPEVAADNSRSAGAGEPAKEAPRIRIRSGRDVNEAGELARSSYFGVITA